MANIVKNRITITGSKKSVAALQKRLIVHSSPSDSEYSWIDYETLQDDEDGSIGSYLVWISRTPTLLDFYVESRWGPPSEALYFMSEDFPDLKIHSYYIGEGPVWGYDYYESGSKRDDQEVKTPEEFEILLAQIYNPQFFSWVKTQDDLEQFEKDKESWRDDFRINLEERSAFKYEEMDKLDPGVQYRNTLLVSSIPIALAGGLGLAAYLKSRNNL